ncbi:diguanylate cyclase [Chromobacterium sp. S0633]|uniref:sensor domain-containing diguanylate cyclase n=1 Tax=unclassified Chromobacterium TaxID=2641838 RepID=UPI000D2F73F5|nr:MULTISPECIES: diguanylate cyclase [unclassified Chromobacterium]MCP1291715.1 diguanylate cyclase [Chromobacterium sp. S0633]PTU67287.1 sensor domain-containing diguanylate cyclase [Chromobacterium sp. Panama]
MQRWRDAAAGFWAAAWRQLSVAAAYWGLARLLMAGFMNAETWLTPAWFPAGLAMAVALRGGQRYGMGLAAGSLLFSLLSRQLPLADALLIAGANTVGSLLGALLVRYRCGRRLPLHSLSYVQAFIAGAALAAAVAAMGGTAALLHGQPQLLLPLGRHFIAWWLADLAGIFSLTPCLLLLRRAVTGEGHGGLGSLDGLTAWLTLLVAGLAMLGIDDSTGRYAALPYCFSLPLLWFAFRQRLRLAHGLSLGILLLALAGGVSGHGAFGHGEQALLTLSMLMLIQTTTLLVFGALAVDLRRTEARLRGVNRQLEGKVRARTRELADSEARLRLMADAAPFPLAMNRLQGGELIYANARAEELFRERLAPGRPLRVQDFYVDPTERERVSALLRVGGCVRDREVRLRAADGREFWALISCSVVRADDGWFVINGVNDISERKQLEQDLLQANQALRQNLNEIELLQQGLREQALRDPLTGLFNRRHLDDILPRILSHMLAVHRDVAVLMVDADHFKQINDRYGHPCGDAVLTALAAHLSDAFRSGDIVCRYGGEEFFILLPGASLNDAYAKARQLCHDVRVLPIVAGGHDIRVTLSVGLALCPLHGTDAGSVVAAADAALYRAKKEGRDRVCVADPMRPLVS